MENTTTCKEIKSHTIWQQGCTINATLSLNAFGCQFCLPLGLIQHQQYLLESIRIHAIRAAAATPTNDIVFQLAGVDPSNRRPQMDAQSTREMMLSEECNYKFMGSHTKWADNHFYAPSEVSATTGPEIKSKVKLYFHKMWNSNYEYLKIDPAAASMLRLHPHWRFKPCASA